jgi:hypothetical protein
MKKVIITQSNYIPWKGYFDSIHMADHFIVYDDMQFTKRDWRNRNKIKTKDGLLWLTIPVEVKGKYLQKINETLVSDPKWGQQHWKTIQFNYNKAPYFKTYKDIFEDLYLNNDKIHLTEINLSFISTINKILGINTQISFSSDYDLVEGKTEKLVDLCKKVGATDYYSGPAAKNYMDETLFEEESIKVHYFDYSGYPEYNQLYGAFAHDVSILDLLFNEGEHAKNFMKSFPKA